MNRKQSFAALAVFALAGGALLYESLPERAAPTPTRDCGLEMAALPAPVSGAPKEAPLAAPQPQREGHHFRFGEGHDVAALPPGSPAAWPDLGGFAEQSADVAAGRCSPE